MCESKNTYRNNVSVLERKGTSVDSINIEELNKCDWCLAYGVNVETKKKHFKRQMLQKGKSIHINLCSGCVNKLKEILED